VEEELWVQHLRTNQRELVMLGKGNADEARLGTTSVSGLMDFDDISYDEHADLLYNLAGQVVAHLKTYLARRMSPRCCGATRNRLRNSSMPRCSRTIGKKWRATK